MNLSESRRRAAELSGGTSDGVVKLLVLRCLEIGRAGGSLLDFGAGKGELLELLQRHGGFRELAGADLLERPNTLPESVAWYQQDLNDAVRIDRQFDTVVCAETIEHLENPRHVFRSLHSLVRPGGTVVLTMPNQESVRSFAGLLFGGHFVHFRGASYPAHITALLRLDLVRMCAEVGFSAPTFCFTDKGGIPKLPAVSWQRVSFGLLKGRWFSDNLGLLSRRVA